GQTRADAGATTEPPLPDAKPETAPGLLLTFRTLVKDPAAPERDTRSARLVALYVPAGEPPAPLLPGGPSSATWEGDLNADLRDTVVLSATGRGSVAVLVNDKPVFEASGDDLGKKPGQPVTLQKGANKLAVRYESPAQGDAVLRLYQQTES